MCGLRRATLCGVLALACGLAACQRRPVADAGAEHVHYLIGAPWKAGANWFYPRETFDLQTSGVATIAHYTPGQILADGVVFRTGLVTGGHQTLPLPAVLRVTNLDNGRSITLRIDDRGPAEPSRSLALSPQAATLLGASGPIPVSIEQDGGWSQALAQRLGGGSGPRIAAAPVAVVQTESLPPPGSTAAAVGAGVAAPPPSAVPDDASTPYADRPPPIVTLRAVGPVSYAIDGGSFSDRRYAVSFAARIGGRFTSSGGRRPSFEVLGGPYPTLQEADTALDLARQVGLTGAKLIVEQ